MNPTHVTPAADTAEHTLGHVDCPAPKDTGLAAFLARPLAGTPPETPAHVLTPGDITWSVFKGLLFWSLLMGGIGFVIAIASGVIK